MIVSGWNNLFSKQEKDTEMKDEIVIPELFKAEDFLLALHERPEIYSQTYKVWSVLSARIANVRFKEWAGQLPRMYGKLPVAERIWNTNRVQDDTHMALLAFVQELPKKKCEHEPIYNKGLGDITPGKIGFSFYEENRWHCYKCGAKLKAVWSEA